MEPESANPPSASAHLIKLTEIREIAPHVRVHPDEERWGRRGRRKRGRPLRS